MDEYKPVLKDTILEVVSNQLEMNEPPETKETLERLIGEGHSEEKAREMIGAIVSVHIYDVMKNKKYFDNVKYIEDLKKLPQLPWEGGNTKNDRA